MRVLDRARVWDGAALRSCPWSPCEAHWHALPDSTRTGSAATVPAVLSRLGRGTAVAGNRRPAALPRGCRRPPATDVGARAPVGAVAAGDPGQERSSSQAADGAGRVLRPPSGNGPRRCSPLWLTRRHPGLKPLCGIGSGRFRGPANNHHRSVTRQSFRQSAMVGNDAGHVLGPTPLTGSVRCIHRVFCR